MDKGHHKNQGENAQDSGTVQADSAYAAPVMKTLKERQMTLAANLKKFRAARGLTQQQVYEAAGVSKSSYTGYEAGHGMPSADKALAMAKVLGVTTDELLMDESELLISDDMRPILRRFEALPVEIRNQARIALKGVLFGYEQEALR
ncbi:helix-turn-helix domain-containing protein [Pseudomonas aeruginosa]